MKYRWISKYKQSQQLRRVVLFITGKLKIVVKKITILLRLTTNSPRIQERKLSLGKVKKTVKKVHYNVAKKPHDKLLSKSKRYLWWHTWQYKKLNHGHIHWAILTAWSLFVVFIAGSIVQPVSALSTWTQSDWSGGIGVSTTNQYSSASSIDASSSGQLSLSQSANSFTNESFNTNITGWKGSKNNHESTIKYSGAGSNKITAGGVSANLFYPYTADSSINANGSRFSTGDLNNDGIDDIVVNDITALYMPVYIGNGDGTLASPINLGTTATRSSTIADFNQDGWNDIAVARSSQANVLIYYNDGAGNFSTATTINGTHAATNVSIKSDDLNNDGYPDIVSHLGPRVTYMNNHNGTFTTTAYLSPSSNGFDSYNTIVDLNGDSLPEIVFVVGGVSCLVYIQINNGSGFEAATSHTLNNCAPSNNGVYTISSGDLNKDGYGDVVVSKRNGSGAPAGDGYKMSALFGSGSGTLTGQIDYASQPGTTLNTEAISTVVADFSGDGYPDIVQTHGSNRQFYFQNNGNGTFAANVELSIASGFASGLSLDINGDDRADFAILNTTNLKIHLYVNRTLGDAMTQHHNFGNVDYYQLRGYVYTTGDPVTSADAQLFVNGSTISTSYAATSTPGWYELTGKTQAVNRRVGYGIVAKQGKTVYVDDMKLYKYSSNGTLTSAIYDLGYGGDWGALTYTTSNANNTIVKIRSGNNSNLSDASGFAGCPAITSGTDLSGQNCITNNHRYIQYEITLNNDNGDTPVFGDILVQYDPWDTDPPDSNATNIVMKRNIGGDDVSLNGWTNGATPYFEWDAGSDNGGGSGIKGYCLYLGTDNAADPISTKGILGASPLDTDGACQFAVGSNNIDTASSGYIGSALTTSNSAYFLNVKAIDNANNIYSGSNAQYQFRFDNTPPTNPAFITAPSQFVASKDVTLTWPNSGGDSASDANSGIAGLQYKIGGTTWYGDNHSGAQDSTDLLANDGSYTTTNPPDHGNLAEGNNIVYFRTYDQAGNTSSASVTTVIKLNTTSPSSPQNVTAAPGTNTTNSFGFSWAIPNSFTGSASNLTYCYTINTLPTGVTCTYTAAGVTSLPSSAYATQPGENTFYVVAKDEAGNINYATAASATFTANTSAPGLPLDIDIADVSIKSTSSWKLALTWNRPTDVGAGIANYRVYRSIDNNNFSQVATTSGASYVDSSLNAVKYYYKVKACDSANNCGAFSATVGLVPTGKFTSPATLTVQPKVTGISTKKAIVTWGTDRDSDSKVSIGIKSGEYQPFQVASDNQRTDHRIELNNLTPGTTYFIKAIWTDEDGNTGYSSELSFKTELAPSTQEVLATRVTLNSALIRFTSVSAAKVVLQYGKSDNFGGAKEISTSLLKSTYDAEIIGLDDGTKYFYRINTYDSEGNEYVGSTVLIFTTPARPRITNLRFQPLEGEPTSTQQISWKTNVPTTSLIRYTQKGGVKQELSDSKLTTDHELVIKDLVDDSEYNLVAESRDADGNLAVSDAQILKTALDTRPPKISKFKVETSIRGSGSEARGQIVVSWQTDEPATSQVAYDQGSGLTKLNKRTSEDGALATEHIVIIADLATSRVYSVRPISKDKATNEVNGSTKSAIIEKPSDNVMTIVLNALKGVFGF